ncbi:hypothetical protein EBE87_13500 [Pseudoroseomonas wenyumeiae]|uniref:DUF2946 domain-containing protein n=1 Tax=Teichococcus wenyumeiae TaxID=2478470 RepID=A0A3A9J3Y2_9PROT|nr:hypothetical protein [Pseudoroseomonas wenyumeiae]RKK01907.1 hypothetical protein D6Z83_22540 [Pseudoroseomonas wenyumeiae]RMI20837.1 hypothetical protein EBE87_13500 [Pseudoroseomonas wenyumeiae]
MTRLRPFLLRLIVALLIVQGVAAPAHCLERLAQVLSVPLCGGGTASLGHDGDAPAPHHGQDGCVVCHALPQGPAPQGPQLSAPGSVPVALALAWPEDRFPVRGRQAQPYAARAPPQA